MYQNFKREKNQALLRQLKFLEKTDDGFPPALKKYERMPKGIYVLGRLPDPNKKSVAIVGARECSPYGRAEALRFSCALAKGGVQVISGLAHGIDSFAHQGALDGGGYTCAVMGCGTDVCYPRANAGLYHRILEQGGGILSEFPPGTAPMGWHFPLRNRIISALADIILVVEARKRSGSLLTVEYALEQGKSVYAIPGRNREDLSEGTNLLILQGAEVALSPELLLEELGMVKGEKQEAQKQNTGHYTAGRPEVPGEKPFVLPEAMTQSMAFSKVAHSLQFEAKSLNQLLQETGLELHELGGILLQLCFSGYAVEDPTGFFSRL